MPIDQLNNEGNIIGYKPDLKYEKNSKDNIKSIDSSQKTDYTGNITYSNALSSFIDMPPSKVLKDINFIKNNLGILVDKLSKSFKVGNWNKFKNISTLLTAFENNNSLYIEAFVEYHHNNINGSIIPELIQLLYEQKLKFEELDNTVKMLYYGNNNIELEEAIAIDKAYVEKIKAFEENKMYNKINYASIHFDSVFNKILSQFVYKTSKQTVSISNIPNTSKDESKDSSKIDIIKDIFFNINDDIDYRKERFSNEQNNDIMNRTLFNYYKNRKKLLDINELSSTSNSTYIKNKSIEYKNNLDDSIKLLIRHFLGNCNNLKELAYLEEEKQHILNIYQCFNYKI